MAKLSAYHQSLSRNCLKLRAGSFLFEMLFFIPIFVPFLQGLGFTMQQVFMLEGAFALMLVLLEIPSGYFADLYGRKLALVWGSVIELLGITIFVFSNSFTAFFIGELVIGIGASLVSGAGEALLYDTLLELKREERYKKEQGAVFFYGRISSVIANSTGAMLGALFLRLPFYITFIPFLLWVILNTTLIEPKRHESEMETWPHFKQILKDTLVHIPKLRYFIIYTSIPPAFFIIAFWMYQDYMGFIGIPIFYFGLIIGAMNIVSAIGSKYAEEIERILSPKFSLVFVPMFAVLTFLLLALLKSFWAIPLLLVTSLLWGFILPLFQDFLQKMIASDRRATVLSIRSFMSRGLFLTFGPFLGWIVDVYNIQTAFLVAAVSLFIAGGLSLLTLFRTGAVNN